MLTKDKDVERPLAEELCGRVASLKRGDKYSESVREGEEQSHEITQREESLQQQYGQQMEGLQQIIQSQVERLEEKDKMMVQKDETIMVKQCENQQLREQFREKIYQLEDERKGKDGEILRLALRISELELQLSKMDEAKVPQSVASSGAEGKVSIKLKWRKAPCKIHNVFNGEMAAAVDGNTVYVMEEWQVYVFNARKNAWSQLPDSSFRGCALAIVNGLLTLLVESMDVSSLTSSSVSVEIEELNGPKNFYPCKPNNMEHVHLSPQIP